MVDYGGKDMNNNVKFKVTKEFLKNEESFVNEIDY